MMKKLWEQNKANCKKWRLVWWNPNDDKTMLSTTKRQKQQAFRWLMVMVSLELSFWFYFLCICLYAGYEDYMLSISITHVVWWFWLDAFLVVQLGLCECFDEHENKDLEDKRRNCKMNVAAMELEEWLCG